MKKVNIVFLTMALSFSVFAQDKKAEAHTVGLGFGIAYVSNVTPLVNVSYMINDKIEIGANLTMSFVRSRNSTFDSTIVFTGLPSPATLPAETESRTVNSSFGFGFNPFFRYHFPTKNNLDIYTGAVIPISIGTGNKQVATTLTKADDYESKGTVTTTNPVQVGIGAGALLGCRWFFYENLSIGAETSLGIMSAIANGKQKVVTSVSNSGTNNPATSTSIDDVTTEVKTKFDSQNFTFLHSIGFTLNWYFGCKKKA